MAEIHSDLPGFQCTAPSTALVSSASNMRGERKVLAECCSASSTGSSDVQTGIGQLIAESHDVAPHVPPHACTRSMRSRLHLSIATV